jgi:hypothetical protein
MLATQDRQIGMLDAAELCGAAVEETSFYALLARHGERIVRDADFAACYSEGHRPPLDPTLAAGQGAAFAIPRAALRRAGDGVGAPAPGLEGRSGPGDRPARLSPHHPGQVSKPGCSCTARSAWPWGAPWSWQGSWAAWREPSSRSSTPRRCSVLPPPRTWCGRAWPSSSLPSAQRMRRRRAS